MRTDAKHRILLADDQELFRSALGCLIKSNIPSAELAGSSADGRETVQQAKEANPDLIIMDLVMPELNGIDAIRQIVQTNPAIGILVLSMHCEPYQIDEALKAGARGYLLKDSCSVSELVAAITALLDGKTYLCPKVADWLVKSHLRLDGSEKNSVRNPFTSLSSREREVLQLLAEGMTSKEIAARLFIGTKTVETHRSQLMSKLNMRSIAELTKFAVRSGLSTL